MAMSKIEVQPLMNEHPIMIDGYPPEDKFMDIGGAVKALKAGHKIMCPGMKGAYYELQLPDDHSKMSMPYIFKRTPCGNQIPCNFSHTDVLREDWSILVN